MISIQSSLVHNKIAGLSRELKHGDFIVIKVISGTDSKYQISIKGVLIPVKSDLILKEGSILKARVIRTGDVLQLKLVEGGKTANILNGPVILWNNLPEGPALERITRSFIRSGLPLNPEILNQLPGTVKRKAFEDDTAARLLTLLLRKDITPSEEGFNALFSLLERREPSEEKNKRKKEEEHRDEEGDTKPEAVIKTLKNQWIAGETESPLHLFNHISSEDGHWMILPFRVGGGAGELEGFLSVHIEKGSNSPSSFFIRCFSEQENRDFLLKWNKKGKGKHELQSLYPLSINEAVKEKKWQNLLEKLQNLGVIFVDNNRGETVFDGFSAEADKNIKSGIERYG